MVDRPHWGWWVSIGGGIVLLGIVTFVPAAYAAWSTYVTDALAPGLLQIGFVLTIGIHVAEALYAARLAREAGLGASARGWFWQTFALGFPSLRLLRRRVHATG